MTLMNDQQDYAALDTVISTARANGNVSPALNLNVLKPDNLDSRLPRPAITDAEDRELDLGSFAGDTTITCAPWSLIAVGQRVWLDVDGTRDNGTATTHTLLTASAVTAAQVRNGLRLSLSRKWLESLLSGSAVEVKLAVTFNGSTDTSKKINFRIANYTLRSGGGLEDFETARLGSFSGVMSRPLCTLDSHSTNRNYCAIEMDPSYNKSLVLTAIDGLYGGADVKIEPKFPTRFIRFDYVATRHGGVTGCGVRIYFEDESSEYNFLEGTGLFSSKTGKIKYFTFGVSRIASLKIDNIRFGS